ncbi:glycosyltransferase [Paenibacillus sp. ACRRX]|uniref:glycosyltransferase n=1 Tax=Paenibacillus sp. ACRRX TaxID=2918206 RepID=UPI001EF55F36|nr:glycosyltransferase [Paenibacillus sp. ACRRX]MCG7407938.1 glycosyltransferase [Paenibacillus sp. ACRRX]
MNKVDLSFSIVICTYNRDEYLERTLKSLNHLLYENFEVVVVNGPSTDRTKEILERYVGKIKIVNNSEANLSISRNLGIQASNGDIVAFIDDDAIPEPNWLHQIKELYDQNKIIGGGGGRVYGPGGDHFQFHNGIIDIWGEADVKREQPGQYIQAINHKFNIMMGVNSTFLRKALLENGGFDEYYEYYHDESDVCVRLTRAGYPIFHHQEAYMHHEFAKSHIRTSIYKLNWYPIVKNTVYFGIKNSKGIASFLSRLIKPYLTANKRKKEFKHWLREGNINKEDYVSFIKMWKRGVKRGYIDGFFGQRRTNFNLEPLFTFLPFIKDSTVGMDTAIMNSEESPQSHVEETKDEDSFGVCFLSKYYPPYGMGGVATYTKVLAEGIAAKGHSVYVITSSTPEAIMVINDVNVINVNLVRADQPIFDFLPDEMHVTKTNLEYSWKASLIVEDLFNKGHIQILESPLWDYEGLVSSQIKGLKTYVRLETPLKVAAKMQNWNWNSDLQLSSELEKQFIESSSGVITISDNVKETIGQLYGIEWKGIGIDLVPLGLEDRSINYVNQSCQNSNDINLLFLGRLEPRKGIDLLLDAAVAICHKHSNVKFQIAGQDNIPFKNGKTIKSWFQTKYPLITEQVQFLGEVTEEDKTTLLSECDIFIAPSRYESFGLVYLEAMQFGKAVIGTNAGGIPEIIEHEIDGLLIENENSKMLEEYIDKLITNADYRLSLGQQARNKYAQYFTENKMIENTILTYLKQRN